LPISNGTIDGQCLAKEAASLFPLLNNYSSQYLDRQYLKQIGVVVVQLFCDTANDNKINFSVVESYVGSLDRSAIDPSSKSSIYIDSIINANSKYINFFSNVRMPKAADTILIKDQLGTALGFTEAQTEKKISYLNSIAKPLTTIFDRNKDPNTQVIDLVIDAGVSNIAQYVTLNPTMSTDFVW